MPLTKDEEKELAENGMEPGTIARFYYDAMKTKGLSHKESVRNYIDGLNNMQSQTLSKEQLSTLKSIIGRVKGQMF